MIIHDKKNHGNLEKKMVKEMKNKTKLIFNQSNVEEKKMIYANSSRHVKYTSQVMRPI
jgi:hypothetical protein